MKTVNTARGLVSAAALSLIATMLLSAGPVAAARESTATPASAAAQGSGARGSAISVGGVQPQALGAARPVSPAAPLALTATAPQFGTKDQSFSGASTAPSGSKPESKLWYNDGIWWADMWDTVTSRFHIFRLSSSGLVWQDTGTVVDNRGSTRADALWDGVHLYIASHDVASDSSHNTANRPARLYRFSYNSGSKTYSMDSGFPVTITTVSVETLVIDKDSTGTLWATWTQAKKLVIAHTTSSDLVWGTPFTPTLTGTSLNSDDVSSLIAFGANRIGVMWSNQSASHMYFSTHHDGDPDTTWTASEAATTGSGSADDHINLKTDSAGRIYAATKTSFTSTSAVLIHLLVRAAGGGWSDIKFGTVADSHTRPIVLIDEQAGVVHMYATGRYPGSSSGQSGGSIFEKTSPISALSFTTGSGTPVIQDPTSADMNNATSTKQNVNASTGIVIVATNDTKDFYWHSNESLGGGAPPTANFSGTPTSGGSPLTVAFTDTSTGSPASWSWDFGDPGSGTDNASTAQSPSHTYNTDGTYTVTLTATNANGSTTKMLPNYVVVGTSPVAVFSGTPTTGASPLPVSFTDASTGSPTSWTWDFGDPGSGTDNASTIQNPSHTYSTDGSYTVKLTVSNATGTDLMTRSGYIKVGTAPSASFTATPTSGSSPLIVAFADTTTNNPTSWSWNFGDPGSGSANTSILQNPSHTYNSGGTYTVTLTATNALGFDTSTQTGLITVTSSDVTLTLNPVADSYVSSSNLTGNYGTLTTMKVREGDGSSANPNYRTYLKFDVSGVSGTVSAVTLRLFVTDPSANIESVFVVGDSSWTETGITYTNAPAISGSAVGTTKSAPVGAYVSITLTPTSVTPGSSPLTLALKSSATDSFIVSSREDPTNKPQLIVTFH